MEKLGIRNSLSHLIFVGVCVRFCLKPGPCMFPITGGSMGLGLCVGCVGVGVGRATGFWLAVKLGQALGTPMELYICVNFRFQIAHKAL